MIAELIVSHAIAFSFGVLFGATTLVWMKKRKGN